jgi:hypothetical protein
VAGRFSKNLLPISGSDEKWQDDYARIYCLYRISDEKWQDDYARKHCLYRTDDEW